MSDDERTARMTPARRTSWPKGRPDQQQAVEQVGDAETPGALVAGHLEQQEGPGRHHHRRDLRPGRHLRPADRAVRPRRRVASCPLDPPSRDHLLGTNVGGQDIFSQLIYGTRVSLLVGLFGGALRDRDRPGHRHDLRLHRGHDRRRHPVLPDQRRPRHPGAAADHHPGRLLRGARHRADRRRHRDHVLGRRGPRPSGRRSSRCATATSSPPRSSPARGRCGSSSARSCPT